MTIEAPRRRKKRKAIEPGIRPWKGGLQGYIRVRGTLHTKDFAIDEPLENIRAWRLRTKRQHFGGGIRGERGSFGGDIERYLKRVAAKKTIKQMTAHLQLWAQALGRDRSRHTITDADIDMVMQVWLTTPSVPDYAAKQRGRPSGPDGLDPQTVQKRRSTLRSFFRVMNGKGGANPVRGSQSFPSPKPEARGTDYATIARVLSAMPDFRTPRRGQPPSVRSLSKLRAAVIAYTGIPPGLLAEIEPGDLTFTTEPATCRIDGRDKGEGGVEARRVPLSAEGRAAFWAFDQAQAYGGFESSPLNRSFQRACRRVGVSGLVLYDLRHSFGAQLYRTTRDLATVGRLLLHAEGSPVTARYAKAANAAVDVAAVAAFSATLPPSPEATIAPTERPKLSPKVVPSRKPLKTKRLRRVV